MEFNLDDTCYINRTAIVIRPKKPFFDLMKYVYEVHFDEVEDPKEMCLDLIVYLVPSIETIEEMEVWLSINYDIIFQEQLRTSVSHGKHLVENRTFEMFKEWFDYSLHSEVWDTVDGEIVKY